MLKCASLGKCCTCITCIISSLYLIVYAFKTMFNIKIVLNGVACTTADPHLYYTCPVMATMWRSPKLRSIHQKKIKVPLHHCSKA